MKSVSNVSKMIFPKLGAAVLLFSVLAACSGSGSGDDDDDGPPTTPTVLSNSPLDLAIDVPRNTGVSATFSEAMDPASLNTTTFTLTSGAALAPVQGTVIYLDSVATFWSSAHLSSGASFTATVTTNVKSAQGVSLAAARQWTFETGNTLASGQPVNLGTAGGFAVLAKTGISTGPASDITGDIGVSPVAATYITGFGLSADASNEFSTTPQVTGKVYAADYAPPTPAKMTTAVSDMETAFTDAASRAPGVTELGAGDIGGMTLAAGVYKWSSGLLIPSDLTLSGSATDVWIFQIAGDLTVANSTDVILAGAAQPKNIFWQVSGFVEIGTTAHLEGVVLSQTAIHLRTGSSIDGRLLAQTAVTSEAATIVEPAN